MSILATDCYFINTNLTNTSPTKQMFSFAKTERFKVVPAPNPNLCYEAKPVQFNQHPESSPVGRTSFGIVRPELFYHREKFSRPSPSNYRIKSGFKSRTYAFEKREKSLKQSESAAGNEVTSTARSVTSFGVGREAFNKVVGANNYNH